MNKFLLITKINLLNFFNFQRNNNSQYKSINKKNYFKLLILVIAFLYLAYYIYYLSDNLMPGLIKLNIPNYLFGILYLIVNLFIITSNIFKVKSVLFDFKDYDLLFSLPIKRNTILLSKVVSLYILNLFYTILFMIPCFIAYIKYLPFNNYILYFLLLFIIPIVPMIISIIIGIFISFIISKFINKTVGGYIVNMSIIIIAFFISFKLSDMSSIDMANLSFQKVNEISSFYPFVNVYQRLMIDFNIIDLLIFLIIPIILIILLSFILNHLYIRIRSGLIKNYTFNNYQIKKYQVNSPYISLYKKEIKRFFTNSMYPLNTIFGCVLLILLILGILIFNDNTIAKILSIDELSVFLKNEILMIICIFCVISSTTHCSISLEGKSFWISRMLPVKPIKILMSKVMVNLTFLIPTVLISGTFFGIYLNLQLIDFLVLYLMPIAYSFFISQLGLILNLIDPKFNFTNEVQVIKQSLPVFLTFFIGIIFVIIPFSINEFSSFYSILITALIFIIDIVLFIILNTYGIKKFNEL